MSKPKHLDSASLTHSTWRPTHMTKATLLHFLVLFTFTFSILVALVFFWLEFFQLVHFLTYALSQQTLMVPSRNASKRRGAEAVGMGQVEGPEDLVYDEAAHIIYTGCRDGWIKRVTVNESVGDSVVQNWVKIRGRPLGLAMDRNGVVLVADSEKGLVRVTREGKIEVLVDEVEGLKFKLTDGVDVAKDGTIYFTDASYKYSLNEFIFDFLEGKPHGRFMSYDPSKKHTTLLASDLYFPNGVAVSPNQQFVVFCETTMRRCRKYHIHGPEKGRIENFIDNLPGLPDNIHYREGHYWIAMATCPTYTRALAMRYPFIRKAMAILVKYVARPCMEKNGGGILVVNLEGKPTAHYYDIELSMISSGIKIGNHIYCGSLFYSFILRLDVKQCILPSLRPEEKNKLTIFYKSRQCTIATS